VARIKDSSVEAVKAAVDIVAVVEGRTRLRKQGASLKGLCPFHQEKTPSFSVMPDRGTYHCFGCGEGGDAIDFVEKMEGVDFVGAIEWLADRFNVPLEYEEASPEADARRRRRDRLQALLEQATSFYERYLWESAAGDSARGDREARPRDRGRGKHGRDRPSASGARSGRRFHGHGADGAAAERAGAAH